MFVIGYPLLAIINILDSLLFVYMLVVIASVVCTWVQADPRNALVRIIMQATEPVFYKLRKHIPPVAGLDLAPVGVLAIILFIRTGILPIFSTLAQSLL